MYCDRFQRFQFCQPSSQPFQGLPVLKYDMLVFGMLHVVPITVLNELAVTELL